MKKLIGAGLVLGALLAPVPGALAQGEGVTPILQGMARSGPQCPQMTWHIQQLPGSQPGTVAGVVWYQDMSGVSIARGTAQMGGSVNIVLTSVSGAGPTGTVTGTRGADGSVSVVLDGPGCSKLRLRLPQSNMAPSGGG